MQVKAAKILHDHEVVEGQTKTLSYTFDARMPKFL